MQVCPADISIPDLMSHARHAYLKEKGPRALTLGHRVCASYGTFDRIASKTAPVSNWMLRRTVVRRLMEPVDHIDSRAHLPPFHSESFESWFRKRPRVPKARKIVYFVDSYANYNEPSFARAIVLLLEHMGYEVILPHQKESGMPALEF